MKDNEIYNEKYHQHGCNRPTVYTYCSIKGPDHASVVTNTIISHLLIRSQQNYRYFYFSTDRGTDKPIPIH